MEIIKSYSKENAVKVIAFAIYFSEELSNEDINDLISKIEKVEFLKTNLPKIQKQEEISVTIAPNKNHIQTKNISGISYSKLNDNEELIWTLDVDKKSIIIRCGKYTRWDKVSLEAYSYIEKVFHLLPSSMIISQIVLEYLDEFDILDDKKNWKKDLFKENNDYITSNIYKLNDFWHINQGYFLKIDTLNEKLLDTININYFLDVVNKINIRMQHSLDYDDVYIFENIEKIFHSIHVHSKNIFEKIVHENILEKFNRGKL